MSSFRWHLSAGGSGLGGRLPRQQRQRIRSSADGAASSPAQQQSLLNNPWVKSGLISGSLSLAGDVLAQLLSQRNEQQAAAAAAASSKGKKGSKGSKGSSGPAASSGSGSGYDAARAARMGTFGLFFYGPYQHWWYGLLARTFPGATVPVFATKVALNQLCLAPVTISVAFAWNLALQGKLQEFPAKLRSDFKRTMLNGWKFWVPAATINFVAVPLQYQVLYMSTCGMCWTGYLSYQAAAKSS